MRWCRDQAYYDQDKWRGTWAYDGGVLSNSGMWSLYPLLTGDGAHHYVDMRNGGTIAAAPSQKGTAAGWQPTFGSGKTK